MNSHRSSREKLKTFKNWPICVKHTIFATESSREQVARAQSLEHSRQKFWKIYLSIFRDWKFYLRESCEVSRENLWVSSRLDLPPANKSPDWVTRNIKNPNFEKYSKYFSRLGHWPANEPQKISVWARDWTNPQLSRQNKATQFLKFLTFFAKKKRLSKNN